MNKFVPAEKLSKRKRKELSTKRRGTWGALNPVTRRPKNPKAYSRRKTRKWSDDDSSKTASFDLLSVYLERSFRARRPASS